MGVSPRNLRTFSRVLAGSLNISQTRLNFVPKPSRAAARSLAMRFSSFTESRASFAHCDGLLGHVLLLAVVIEERPQVGLVLLQQPGPLCRQACP